MREKIIVNWMDDSGGVLQTCHINGPGDRKSTYVGEIWHTLDPDGGYRHKWFSKLKGSDEVKEHKSFEVAKRYVEDSVDGTTL